ncbi:MAG: hypothetical protein K0U20_09260 [Proteobacteria bacterium]|nr:hypothetical protein [Pseudomonadota bacterium]MCH9735768.1 hypothetical protein [Actinomycetes bacterium]
MRIEKSEQTIVITDPQRRVYNGCIHSYETVFKDWEVLESNLSEDKAKKRLKFWNELSDFAVSQRGESSRTKYRITKDE